MREGFQAMLVVQILPTDPGFLRSIINLITMNDITDQKGEVEVRRGTTIPIEQTRGAEGVVVEVEIEATVPAAVHEARDIAGVEAQVWTVTPIETMIGEVEKEEDDKKAPKNKNHS